MATEARYDFGHGGFGDYTAELAKRGQNIEFYHLTSGRSVRFKAFIAQFADSFESDWNEEEAYGRMDPIVTFNRTTRRISLAWEVPAASSEEAAENLRKCSLLFSMLYPSYESVNNKNGASMIQSPPLLKLRFFNLIENSSTQGETAEVSGLLGYVKGFTYDPDFGEAGGVYGPGDARGGRAQADELVESDGTASGRIQIYPKLVRLRCDFTVLHQERLGWRKKDGKLDESNKYFPYGIDSSKESDNFPDNRFRSDVDIEESGALTEDRKSAALEHTFLKSGAQNAINRFGGTDK